MRAMTTMLSAALTYPVLLIGQSSLDVRDADAALTSIPGASSLNLHDVAALIDACRESWRWMH
jgi:hypothetical protein